MDLSGVRVHDGAYAAQLSQTNKANAVTRGDDIYFASGAFAPHSPNGRRLIAHELVHVAQQRLLGAEAPASQLDEAPTGAKALKEKYVTFFFPDFKGLAADLLGRLPAESTLAIDVFLLCSGLEQAMLSSAIAKQATDAQLADIAADRGGRSLLWRMFGAISGESSTSGPTGGYMARKLEPDLERVLFAVSPEHRRLKQEPWTKTPEVQAGLKTSGAEIQSISSGWASGLPQFDEYWVIIDSMPPDLTPEAFLAEMATDLNKAVSDYWFDAINEFKRMKTSGSPAVGDVYSIDIKGPDNGSVMLVESAPDHFIFQTVATAKDGTHPEYGSREFGFERKADGSVRFYTRGASRSGMLPGTSLLGRPIQKIGWTRLVTGLADSLAKRGAKVRPNSINSWRSQD